MLLAGRAKHRNNKRKAATIVVALNVCFSVHRASPLSEAHTTDRRVWLSSSPSAYIAPIASSSQIAITIATRISIYLLVIIARAHTHQHHVFIIRQFYISFIIQNARCMLLALRTSHSPHSFPFDLLRLAIYGCVMSLFCHFRRKARSVSAAKGF